MFEPKIEVIESILTVPVRLPDGSYIQAEVCLNKGENIEVFGGGISGGYGFTIKVSGREVSVSGREMFMLMRRIQNIRDRLTSDQLDKEMPPNVCRGCGRPEVHKMCPAWGTPKYMSGDVFTEQDEITYADVRKSAIELSRNQPSIMD